MEKLRVRFDGRLTEKQIVTIIEDYVRDVVPTLEMQEAYSKGNNPAIAARYVPSGAPDNQIPVPYGRRITSLITGYMFLPGLITYNSENQAYLDSLLEIFKDNKEPLETYRLGWQTTVHGVGYEMFFNEGRDPEDTLIDGRPAYTSTVPRFVSVPIKETIPVYDFEIIPNLQAFIRFYTIEAEEAQYIEVYYADKVVYYERRKNGNSMVKTGEQPHGYDRPPLVVYENNEDLIGDFAAVVPLIDAYDVLMSDSMNEFDRFAQAYLVAKGFTITTEDVDKLKHKRAFSLLNPDDKIEFLTKPIEVEFIKYISEQLRAEIHRGSGIPNLDDFKWGGDASGETISKFIYMMDLFTSIKESYFKEGLRKRIELLTAYAGLAGDAGEINAVMNRNGPDESMMHADLFGKYSGHVSQRTLLENFADFIDDVDQELEQLKEEKEATIDLYGLDEKGEEEEPKEEKEEPGAE